LAAEVLAKSGTNLHFSGVLNILQRL